MKHKIILDCDPMHVEIETTSELTAGRTVRQESLYRFVWAMDWTYHASGRWC